MLGVQNNEWKALRAQQVGSNFPPRKFSKSSDRIPKRRLVSLGRGPEERVEVFARGRWRTEIRRSGCRMPDDQGINFLFRKPGTYCQPIYWLLTSKSLKPIRLANAGK